jgi:outer membrane protein TolC
MLRPIDAPITPTDKLTFTAVETTLEDVLKDALSQRPELAVAETTEGIRKELLGVAKAESKPSFEFVGNYGRSSRKAENWWMNDYAKWNTAITMKIPVFDGQRSKGRVAQAQAEVEKARQDRIALANQIRVQAMNVITRLNVAQRLITAAQLNVEQATKALEMTQANYNYGAATVLDVTDAQNSLVQSEMTLAQALQEHENARATLNYVKGRDPLEAGNVQ